MESDINVNDIMNNLPVMIYQSLNNSPQYTFTFVSAGCKNLTGYSPKDFISGNGLNFFDIVHLDDIEPLKELYEATLAVGINLETKFRIITKEKEEKWIWVRSRVIDTDDGGMPYVIEGIFVDITNQLRAEVAELGNRAQFEFLSKIALQIRTSMNTIIGISELALQEKLTVKVYEYLEMMRDSSKKLISSLTNIVYYEKIVNGDIEVFKEEYNFSLMFDNVVNTIKEKAYHVGIEFKTHIDNKIPNLLVGDSYKIVKILENLLSNAVKFTDRGYVSLSIEGDIGETNVNLKITIEDTGRGIKEENLKNIYDAFTQFDTKNIQGNGLGLTVVHHLVISMGGSISVQSIYGVGSIFTIILPQDFINSQTVCESFNAKKPLNFAIHHTPRVLVVDDVRANLVVAGGLLDRYEIHVDLCESGESAIEAVKSNHYDLILMDYLMPIMSGVETTLRIRELVGQPTDCKKIPIIALTADVSNESKAIFLKNSFDGYLAKPIDIFKLNTIIEKWIPGQFRRKSEKTPTKQGAACEANAPKALLNDINFEIPGIDIKAGIALSGGNINLYIQVVKEYYKSCRKLIREIKDCLKKENIKLYTIHLHAIKGASDSIGAIELTEFAKELELAGTRGDLSFIHANTPKIIDDLELLLDNIYPVIIECNYSGDAKIEREGDTRKVVEIEKERKKILLIDDTGSFLMQLSNILKDDYETMISKNGEDGLETAKLTIPDLIFLDVMMPGLSGYEVLEVLKNDEELKHIPVFMITAESSVENEAKGYELGAIGYVKKPFERDEVKNKVHDILD